MGIIWFLIVGAVVGWLAGLLMKGRGFGLLGNIAVGVLGAIIGGWLAGMLGLSANGPLGGILVALGGAIVLLAVVGLIKR